MANSFPSLITAAQLAERLDQSSLVILDTTVRLERPAAGGPYQVVSGRAAYEQEHLPGAGFADLAGVLSDPDSRFPFTLPTPQRFAREAGALGIGPGRHVIAYAQHEPMWATRLWWLLRFFGFDQVSVLDGGLTAWRAAGLPLEAGGQSHRPASFVPTVRPQLLAKKAEVKLISDRGEDCLINALQPGVFRGEGVSSYKRPGRIPGSVNVPWTGLIDPSTGRFRAHEDLRTAFESARAGRSSGPVIAYCGGGISATVDLFALHLLGDDSARLYDGSLTEWTDDRSLPVETG